MLVREMMDIPFIIGSMLSQNAKLAHPVPVKAFDDVGGHLRSHHITAKQVGEMAGRADVKQMIITHFVAKEDAKSLQSYKAEIAKQLSGKISIANDLDKY